MGFDRLYCEDYYWQSFKSDHEFSFEFSFYRANIHTYPHTYPHRDKVIATYAPPYYDVSEDN